MPEPSEDTEKIQWKKNSTKARKIMIDSVMNHLLPIISKLKTAKEMFDTQSSKDYMKSTIPAEPLL